MPRWFHACLAALALGAAARAAAPADTALEVRLHGLLELARAGKIEHAQRLLGRLLDDHPGNATLLEVQANLAELYVRERGARAHGATPPPVAAAVALPPAAARTPVAGQAFTIPDLDLTLLWIPPGAFVMATTHGNDDATPVTISRGFWLGRTEVTQEQWRQLRPDHQSPSFFRGSDRPVERISWVETMEFIRALNARERAAGRLPPGYEYSLPTEAEWEYACRAGSTKPWSGEAMQVAWHEVNSGGQTHPVAQLAPNAWGFHDMHGNVSEWCLDGPGPYFGRAVTDPIHGFNGSSAPAVRIFRGGAWSNSAGQSRADQRYWGSISGTSPGLGCRVALAPVRPAAIGLPLRSAEN